MIEAIGPDIWHAQHHFMVRRIPVSSRMTVVRLRDGTLWLHSPIPLSDALRAQLDELGSVRHIVAPSKMHHLFAGSAARAYPQAQLYGPPGLSAKRPSLQQMQDLPRTVLPQWSPDLDQVFFEGLPFLDETAWFHAPSGTLILTDLCQWWQGELPFLARLFARLAGVRAGLAVPRTVRLLVKDRAAARASAMRILAWPIERVVVAHNSVIARNAMPAARKALGYFTG